MQDLFFSLFSYLLSSLFFKSCLFHLENTDCARQISRQWWISYIGHSIRSSNRQISQVWRRLRFHTMKKLWRSGDNCPTLRTPWSNCYRTIFCQDHGVDVECITCPYLMSISLCRNRRLLVNKGLKEGQSFWGWCRAYTCQWLPHMQVGCPCDTESRTRAFQTVFFRCERHFRPDELDSRMCQVRLQHWSLGAVEAYWHWARRKCMGTAQSQPR